MGDPASWETDYRSRILITPVPVAIGRMLIMLYTNNESGLETTNGKCKAYTCTV